jgi:nitroreductase
MDALLAIASRREVRNYASRPVPADAVDRVRQAGRVAGSAFNSQPLRFLVLESEGVRLSAAKGAFAPQNLTDAPLSVAIAVRGGGPPTSTRGGRRRT